MISESEVPRKLDPALAQLVVELDRVGQVAVVGERDLAPVVAPDRLRVLPRAAAGGRVADVADRHVAVERPQLLLVEDLGDEPGVAQRGDVAALAGGDPGRLLAAVLERVEGEVGEPGDVVARRVHAEHAALVARAVAVGNAVWIAVRREPLSWLHRGFSAPEKSWCEAGGRLPAKASSGGGFGRDHIRPIVTPALAEPRGGQDWRMKRGRSSADCSRLRCSPLPPPQRPPGDVYVADQCAGSRGQRGDLQGRHRHRRSDTARSAGRRSVRPADMAFDRDGNLIVADEGARGDLPRRPGDRAPRPTVAAGGQLADPWGVAVRPRRPTVRRRHRHRDARPRSSSASTYRELGRKIQLRRPARRWSTRQASPRDRRRQLLVTDLNVLNAGDRRRPSIGVDRRRPARSLPRSPSGPPLVDPWGHRDRSDGRRGDRRRQTPSGGLERSCSARPGDAASVTTHRLRQLHYVRAVGRATLLGNQTMLGRRPGDGRCRCAASYDRRRPAVTTHRCLPAHRSSTRARVLAEPPIVRAGSSRRSWATPATDKLTGSRFADVIARRLDGNDVIRGDRSNDIICGGRRQRPHQREQGRRSALRRRRQGPHERRSQGPTLLDGGPGRDRCDGKGSHRTDADRRARSAIRSRSHADELGDRDPHRERLAPEDHVE